MIIHIKPIYIKQIKAQVTNRFDWVEYLAKGIPSIRLTPNLRIGSLQKRSILKTVFKYPSSIIIVWDCLRYNGKFIIKLKRYGSKVIGVHSGLLPKNYLEKLSAFDTIVTSYPYVYYKLKNLLNIHLIFHAFNEEILKNI